MTKNKTRTFVHTAILVVTFLPIILVILTAFRDPTYIMGSDILSNYFEDYFSVFNLFPNIHDSISLAIESIPIIEGTSNINLALTASFSNLIGLYIFWIFAEALLFIPKFALKMIRRFTDV